MFNIELYFMRLLLLDLRKCSVILSILTGETYSGRLSEKVTRSVFDFRKHRHNILSP